MSGDLGSLSGDPTRRRKEALIKRSFQGAAALSVVISGAIVLSLIGNAISFLSSVEMDALVADGWFPRQGRFSVLTVVTGTLLVTAVGMLVAMPLGLGAAVYLAEYATPRMRRALKPVIEILAGIPSVVIGFFALTFISPTIVQSIWSGTNLFNMMAAGLGVGILVTPLVASVSEDSLRAVPLALREAAYGMGARKRTTTLRVVLPAAVSGIVASLIIGASRAIGETMVVAMVAGGTGGAALTVNPLEQGQTMTAAMTALAIGSDQVKGADNAFDSLYFLGLVLFAITLVLNVASERFVRKVRQTY